MRGSKQANYEELSPYLLLRTLKQLAQNQIPVEIQAITGRNTTKAWELLEEGTYFFFRQILMLETIRLGANSLFKHEPEGIVLVDRGPSPFALMYECKARSKGYRMSSDDTLRYKDYIKRKKHEIKVKYHLPLTHFLIISSDFTGDVDRRLKTLSHDGTVVCLCSATLMTSLYKAIALLTYPGIKLIEVDSLFGHGVFNQKNIKSCVLCHK